MTEFNASQFDDDLESIASAARPEDASNFKQHPRGQFNGQVSGILKKENNGQPLWEISLRTDEGTAVYTIWGYKHGEVANAKSQAAAGDKTAIERISKTMSRYKKIFTDLGLPAPDGWAGNANSIVARLGELIDRPCVVVVQADRSKPDRSVVFINAPRVAAEDVNQSPPDSAFPDLASPVDPAAIPF